MSQPRGNSTLVGAVVALNAVTATVIAAQRQTRGRVTIKNPDASIAVYVGPATVTALNGMELKAGESITLETSAAVYAIAASATPSVAVLEEHS